MPKGSNENKTEVARQILEQMLAEAVWKNVMLLHHGLAVYEIRNAKGFGMRWTLDIKEKSCNNGIGHADGEGVVATTEGVAQQQEDKDDFEKDWEVTQTTFRGFLEPIAGMDHELDAYG
jgi:hypothetical protein